MNILALFCQLKRLVEFFHFSHSRPIVKKFLKYYLSGSTKLSVQDNYKNRQLIIFPLRGFLKYTI